jgi:hypothetical protein
VLLERQQQLLGDLSRTGQDPRPTPASSWNPEFTRLNEPRDSASRSDYP